MKKISLLLIGLITVFSSLQVKAQEQQELEDLNYFKYVVIPIQYKFQSEENEFLINSLTKHLFNEENFTTYMDVESKPRDLTFNRCLALFAEVKSESESFFSLGTRLQLILKDCNNKVIFKSEGRSKLKDYKEAYHDALKDAFTPLQSFNYEYNGKNSYDSSKFEAEEQKSPIQKEAPQEEKENFEETVRKKIIGSYTLFNEEYNISKIEAGYILTNTATAEKKAFINVTSNNSILFNSETINGTLLINEEGDLEVEYFNNTSGKLEKATLYRIE